MDQQARLLHTDILRIDAFFGGFKPSTITLVDTNHPFAFEMLSMLCVNAVKAFDENVVYVDGGMKIGYPKHRKFWALNFYFKSLPGLFNPHFFFLSF
jgi:hypothetical protein